MEIFANGSKWNGQEPDSVEKLLEMLATYPLDPSFDDERYGRFFYRHKGRYYAFGNFANVSHVFRVSGTLEEMRPIALAIKRNRRSVPYLRLLHSGNYLSASWQKQGENFRNKRHEHA